MVLLTFLLKRCVMIEQEGIMQDVYTFAGTDQCQMPEYGTYNYICKWPRHKAIYFSWLGRELFCPLLGPPVFNSWFSFAPVFQWCCSTPQGSPGVGRNTFLSSPHLCFIIVFICDLFVSRDDPLMSQKTFTRTEQLYVLSHDRSRGRGWVPVKPV